MLQMCNVYLKRFTGGAAVFCCAAVTESVTGLSVGTGSVLSHSDFTASWPMAVTKQSQPID